MSCRWQTPGSGWKSGSFWEIEQKIKTEPIILRCQVAASRAFADTNAILLCKMLVGLCPNPSCSASCRCRLRVSSKHFYNKKDSLGFFHEGRILGYRRLSGFRFFGASLFLCKEQFCVSLCTKKLLHFFFRFAVVRVG